MAIALAVGVALWVGLAAPIDGAQPAKPATAPPVLQPSPPLVLRVGSQDFAALRSALEARLPTVRVFPHSTATRDALRGRELVYAELSDDGTAGQMRLVVILQDGRFYERRFTADEGDRVHSMATTLANTLAAIREERIEPTGDDLAIPEPEPEPAPANADVAVPPPQPAIDATAAPPASVAAPVVVRRWELGLAPAGAVIVGLGPGGVAAPSGAAGLDLDLRLPVGVIVGIGLRYGSRGANDIRMHRFAVQVAAGYSLRRRDFELRTTVGFVAEPWRVTQAGGTRSIRGEDGSDPGPLLGAVISASPGWYWRRSEASRTALRLGMRAQLQLTALASGGIGRVRVIRPSGTEELARIGGVELLLGADAELWFTVGRTTTRARRN
ncbi:MAG TPA: hypothetical protein VFG69_05250 [Nannocystaceae bacterium]|nr:hypothetical protein [Nannocystaceae bacterium]